MGFRKYNFFKKFLDFLTGFVALLTVLAALFLYVCHYFDLLQGNLYVEYVRTAVKYCFGGLVLLAGLEFFSNKNWFFLILYILLAACLGLCIFAPDLVQQFVNLVRPA